MNRTSIAAVAILAAVAATTPARATLTFFEPFNYDAPDGTSLSGQTDLSTNPNRQWFRAGTAAGDPQIIGGSLSYPGLAASVGNSGQLSGAGFASLTLSRVEMGQFDEPAVGQQPVNIYYSMVLRATDLSAIGAAATGSFFTGLQYKYPEADTEGHPADGLSNTEATAAGALTVHAGSVAGTYNLGVAVRDAPNATRIFGTTDYSTSDTLFVVVKYVMGSGNKDDAAYLYINPNLASGEPATATAASISADIAGEFDYSYNNTTGAKVIDGSGKALTSLRSFFLRNNAVEPSHMQIDELRIGTTWADVAPAASLPHLTGDTNNDGVVDLSDLNNVLNNFGSNTPGNPGDENHDNVVDLSDLNNVLNNFGAHAAAAALAVPEPATLAACAMASLAVVARRRRRA